MSDSLAYFITFSCYGAWLHGDQRGSVDRQHNHFGEEFLVPNPALQAYRRSLMKHPATAMDQPHRRIALNAVLEIAKRKSWHLYAVHVRTNHIHVVVQAEQSKERAMNSIKARITFRMNRSFPEEIDCTHWTRHGSTRELFSTDSLISAVRYVILEQGEPMEYYVDPEMSKLIGLEPRTQATRTQSESPE